ncbi:hypothetical protein SAMN05216390_10772 [Lachnospiraceae bacterium KH1T2]|nr:hypothetical protein SAMN05216390_10772 [Lachnospiraceae bacterium KH1T2]
MIQEAYEKLAHEEKRLFAHCAGKLIKDAPKAIIPFYKVVPSEIESKNGKKYTVDEDAFFAALCVRCLFEKIEGVTLEPDILISEGRKNPKISLEGYDRRISALMSNTEAEFFIPKLAKLMNYTLKITSNKIPDCDQLYWDIHNIGSNEKDVQRRWARTIYVNNEE